MKLRDKALLRICVRINERDYEKIKQVAAARGQGVTANRIIRECVASYVRQLDAIERRKLDAVSAKEATNDLPLHI